MLDCLCEYAPIGGEESEVDRNQMTHWQMKLYTTFSKFWEILLKYKKNKLFSISDIVFFLGTFQIIRRFTMKLFTHEKNVLNFTIIENLFIISFYLW